MSTPVTGNVCAQCGQAQTTINGKGEIVTAPMLHAATKGIYSSAEDMVSLHLDCLPHDLEAAHRDRHGSRIDAAKKGVRGDKLREIPDDVQAGFNADDPKEYDAWVKATRKAG